MNRFYILFISLFCYSSLTFAQGTAPKVVLAGTVVNASSQLPIPNVHILRKNGSGTTSDKNGGFSLEVAVGSNVIVTHLGFINARVTVPRDLTDNTYEIVVPLYSKDVTLDVVEVYPYPSREDFKIEFLSPQTAEEINSPIKMSGVQQPLGPSKVPPPTLMNPISFLVAKFNKKAIRNRKMNKYRKIIEEKYQRTE